MLLAELMVLIYNRESVDRKIEIKLWYCHRPSTLGITAFSSFLSSDLGAGMLWQQGSARNIM
jgi:hypothetical protein